MEMVGPKWRVFIGMVKAYFWSGGYISLALLGFVIRDWFILQLIMCIPCVLFFIVAM